MEPGPERPFVFFIQAVDSIQEIYEYSRDTISHLPFVHVANGAV
jgi:hypothetical protein